MIKKISYCSTDMAQQLADLEKEIFGTAWNNELIKQKKKVFEKAQKKANGIFGGN